MIFRAGNRFDKDNYFLTEIDTSVPTCEVSGELNGVPVDWEVGGGGSSNFSTAEVVVVNNADYDANWDNCPTLNLENNIIYGSFYVKASSSITVLVPLYESGVLWDIGPRGLILTGDIEEYADGLLITGNCNITITSA